jgi:hypothetical protein
LLLKNIDHDEVPFWLEISTGEIPRSGRGGVCNFSTAAMTTHSAAYISDHVTAAYGAWRWQSLRALTSYYSGIASLLMSFCL